MIPFNLDENQTLLISMDKKQNEQFSSGLQIH